jgi:peptidoglycan/xylan/chitin deacetylase (PgdA/CDA1 family)
MTTTKLQDADDWTWPGGKRIAVVFDVCVEGWSDGKAPGITPMGNPLPPREGVVDSMAISWAAYGYKRGVYRLLDALDRHGVKGSILVNGVVADRTPEAVRSAAEGGHEIVGHSYAMDLIPALLSEDEERDNITRCTERLAELSGQPVVGWISPRATPSPRTARLLVEAGYLWYGDVLDEDLPYVEAVGDGDRVGDIVAIPFETDVNDMPMLKYGVPASQMLQVFEQNVEVATAAGGVALIDVTTHSHICGHPRQAFWFSKIVEAAAADSNLWVTTRAEIAGHVRATSAEPTAAANA